MGSIGQSSGDRRKDEAFLLWAAPLEQLCLSGVLVLAGQVHGVTVCAGWLCTLDSRNTASFLCLPPYTGSGYLLLLISKSSHHAVWCLSSSNMYTTNSLFWIQSVLIKCGFVFLIGPYQMQLLSSIAPHCLSYLLALYPSCLVLGQKKKEAKGEWKVLTSWLSQPF